jgi:SNF2 family DNA or RNA helicase
LKVLNLSGPNRYLHFADIPNFDLVVSSYALLVRDIEYLKGIHWHVVVLDEAQAIKNPDTSVASQASVLKANQKLCFTGTPIENHLGELWSQFNFLMPGMLGDYKTFNRLFRTPIEKNGDIKRRQLLSSWVKPFILRRTKVEVAPELPSKTTIIKSVELTGQQRDLYETMRLSMHTRVQEEVSAKGFKQSQIVIFDALLKLRQVCCDPRLVKSPIAASVNESAKLSECSEMVQELVEEGRRILIFSQFTSMLDLIEKELVNLQIPFVTIRGDTLDRRTPVQEFQDKKVSVFLLSLKAGGTGLNLTAADTVIHYDPWWNPAVEDQATDRAYRIGQDKPVFVFKLIASGTVEERMIELQERKRTIARGLLEDGTDSSLPISEQDLAVLFGPGS